jgi:hypothetical protein
METTMRKKAQPPYLRVCPLCGNELRYGSVKNRNQAEKKKKICRECSIKEINSRPGIGKQRIKNRREYTGENNPFFGKHHTEDAKKKTGNYDRVHCQSEEFKSKCSRPGQFNGMYGKTVLQVWTEKYGEQEADRKFSEMQRKKSEKSKGSNNPMYGKPSPAGSGNGWGGWYNGWYFRSLRELSYVLVLEKKQREWRSAEGSEFRIPYTDIEGNNRTYRPDFLVDRKILVEVKPDRLMNSPLNVRKHRAARRFCKENGLEYQITDVKIIEQRRLVDMYLDGKVSFNSKYKKRMESICRLAKKSKCR